MCVCVCVCSYFWCALLRVWNWWGDETPADYEARLKDRVLPVIARWMQVAPEGSGCMRVVCSSALLIGGSHSSRFVAINELPVQWWSEVFRGSLCMSLNGVPQWEQGMQEFPVQPLLQQDRVWHCSSIRTWGSPHQPHVAFSSVDNGFQPSYPVSGNIKRDCQPK